MVYVWSFEQIATVAILLAIMMLLIMGIAITLLKRIIGRTKLVEFNPTDRLEVG